MHIKLQPKMGSSIDSILSKFDWNRALWRKSSLTGLHAYVCLNKQPCWWSQAQVLPNVVLWLPLLHSTDECPWWMLQTTKRLLLCHMTTWTLACRSNQYPAAADNLSPSTVSVILIKISKIIFLPFVLVSFGPLQLLSMCNIACIVSR